MMLMDVNVLVYAHRMDVPDHLLPGMVGRGDRFANGVWFSELVLSGFIRVVTHPKVFEQPSPLASALAFVDQIRSPEHAMRLVPGSSHWSLFTRCLHATAARGNDVPDAYHAALALEWDCDWVTTDKGFRRFKGLRVRHPLK
ncbi:MAG: type II toxin-antitoxin system VapC family toxin [Chromatiaceae bacterium]|nr:type II toxin-antitoxin system VapC family toxin [Chromatiaceae bacterium]